MSYALVAKIFYTVVFILLGGHIYKIGLMNFSKCQPSWNASHKPTDGCRLALKLLSPLVKLGKVSVLY